MSDTQTITITTLQEWRSSIQGALDDYGSQIDREQKTRLEDTMDDISYFIRIRGG